jgi:hypothetical protein
MYQMKIRQAVRLVVLLSISGLTIFPTSFVRAVDNPNGPVLPPQCDSIQAPVGTKLAFHAFARGVQIYRWNGTSWDLVAPVASLFAEENYFGEVGSHYIGPTWESKSGSKVEGRRVPGTGCTPDASAVAWLLLYKISSTGPGIFQSVTYIQRVNTTGGTAPAFAGSSVGEVKEVPYTAEYYFYRDQN